MGLNLMYYFSIFVIFIFDRKILKLWIKPNLFLLFFYHFPFVILFGKRKVKSNKFMIPIKLIPFLHDSLINSFIYYSFFFSSKRKKLKFLFLFFYFFYPFLERMGRETVDLWEMSTLVFVSFLRIICMVVGII